MRAKIALLPLTMPLVLAACFGGGGGGGSSSGPLTLDSTPTAFTSFEDITANSLVEATAPSSVNYAADVVGGNVERTGDLTTTGSSALRILTGGEIPPEVDGGDPTLEFGGARLTVNVPGEPGETIVRNFMEDPLPVGAGAAADRYEALVITDDADAPTDRLLLNDDDDLNFMTFGLWELDLTETSRDIGGAAWGATTPLDGAGVMPTGGTATYQGDLIGYNVLAASTTIYVAQSNLEANFGTNAVTFSSTGTRELLTGDAAAAFDIVPTSGAIALDSNTFSGTGLAIVAPGAPPGTFDGTFGGAFYGPDAAEAGGWFELRNVGSNDRYFGSFGGAQLP